MAKITGPRPFRLEPVTLRGAERADAATHPGRSPIQWQRIFARVGRSLWNDKVAAAHTVFYLISAAIFLPLVAGMFLFMQDTSDAPPDPTRGLDSRARSVLHLITSNTGLDSTGSTTWEDFGENMVISEVGIRDEESTMLSYAKIDNLQRGGLLENPGDPWLNYQEFLGALRLGDDVNFHIRMSPVILNPSGDPYGTKPLAGMHVAYVARLGADEGLGTGSTSIGSDHQFQTLSGQATKEIAALKALGLQTDPQNPNAGFDGKFYQPLNKDPLLYDSFPIGNGYVNVEVQQGDVIADTTRAYADEITGGTEKTYSQWFWETYFRASDGDYRYDAIVFGGEVRLSKWLDANIDADPDTTAIEELQKFVKAGGVLIFMGDANDDAVGMIYDCASSTECMFHDTGTQQAPTTPDSTNQMLFVPNKLDQVTWDTNRFGPTWNICNYLPVPDGGLGGGVDERLGFIPISTQMPISDPCVSTYFGATSADRFGPTGGTVILTQWDTATVDQVEVTKMFANLLSYGLLRPVYLDYGPEIPIDAPVVTAERLNLVQFPNGDYMNVKIWMYMWRGGCGGLAVGCVTP